MLLLYKSSQGLDNTFIKNQFQHIKQVNMWIQNQNASF